MQNKFIDDIAVSVRLFALFLIILMLFCAKSLYLIIFILIFALIILMLNNQNLKSYLFFLKEYYIFIILILLFYLICFNNLYGAFILFIKLLIMTFLINGFTCGLNFEKTHSAIYTYLNIVTLKKLKPKLIKVSYDITILIVFLKYLIDSKKEIKNKQICYNRKKHNIKNYFLPRLFFTIKTLHEYENNLKLKFYKLKYEKINMQSILCLVLLVLLFIIVVIKEVIL